MKLLCLDLASVSGFAFGTEAGVQAHGSFRLPKSGNDYGLFLAELVQWLETAVVRWKPESICYESPILPGTGNIHTLRKLYSMGPRVEEFARSLHIQCSEANLMDIRQHFIGRTFAPRTETCQPGCKAKRCSRCQNARRRWLKDTTMGACKRLGLAPIDDNAADAMALFSYAMAGRVHGFELRADDRAVAA